MNATNVSSILWNSVPTNSQVIEQQTYLTQAQTPEVDAKAAWLKVAKQLD